MDIVWFGIRVYPRCEFHVRAELCRRGFESLLPVRRVRRHWSDRIKTLELPLFPGYLFCRFRPVERGRILSSPGVAQILGYGRIPTPVSQEEIDAVSTLTASGLLLVPWPYLQAGQRVRIERGPLAGVQGIVVRAEVGAPRIVVSVDLLQRSVAADIEREWIAPAR